MLIQYRFCLYHAEGYSPFLGLCGERSDDLKDKIRFLRPNNLPENRYVSCIWVIQTYLLSNLTFYFTSFSFRSPCDQTFLEIYNGFGVRNSTRHYHFCSASLPSGLFMLSGPYITIYLRGNGTHLKNQGFQLIYGPNVKSNCFGFFMFLFREILGSMRLTFVVNACFFK